MSVALRDVQRPPLRILHVISGLARRQGGPALNAVGIARAIRSVGGDNAIFSTDVGEAASSRIHTRVTSEDLPPEASDLTIRLFRSRRPYRITYAPDLARA